MILGIYAAMLFDIDWLAVRTPAVHAAVRDWLNEQVGGMELPSFIHRVEVLEVDLGSVPPEVTIRHIGDPFPEMYEAGESEEGLAAAGDTTPVPNPEDTQLTLEVRYEGNLAVTLHVELLLNYPSQEFLTLPVSLTLLEVFVHAVVAVAYLHAPSSLAVVLVLCDIHEGEEETRLGAETPVAYPVASGPLERMEVLQRFKIENELGDGDRTVLRNVGKVERFLGEKLREVLRDELGWPGWICFET